MKYAAWRSLLLGLVAGCLAIFIILTLSSEKIHDESRYEGGSSVFVSYANSRTNADLKKSPTINMGFNGDTRYHRFVMDTGSVGIIASADIFQPAPDAVNLGPGQQFYTSSGIIEKGTWWTATQQIYDEEGTLVATSKVPVLQVTEVVHTKNARTRIPHRHPRGIRMMGVGFSRESPQQLHGTPSYNPFLNLQKIRQNSRMKKLPKHWCNGYVVTPKGVALGLTSQNTNNAGFVKLERRDQFSINNLPEWMPAPMTINVNGVSGDGHILMDTGVNMAFLTPPPNANLGTLAACPHRLRGECAPKGSVISVYLPNQANPVAYYTFTVGQTDNPMQPFGVKVVNRSDKIFFNTSRHVLGGMNFIYDNKHGYVGYIWNENSSDSVGFVKPTPTGEL